MSATQAASRPGPWRCHLAPGLAWSQARSRSSNPALTIPMAAPPPVLDLEPAEQPRQPAGRWERQRGGRERGQAHGAPRRPGHLRPAQLAADVSIRPVVPREVREPQVGMVHLDLPPAAERKVGHGLGLTHEGAGERPSFGRHRCPCRLQAPDRAAHVVRLLAGRAGGAGLDLCRPLLAAARVALRRLTPRRRLQHPGDAVGLAGEVGGDVPDRPARQSDGLATVASSSSSSVASSR